LFIEPFFSPLFFIHLKVKYEIHFLEEVSDLLIGEYIDKDRYLQLKRLFKSEEREFAIKIVKELHDKHIIQEA